MAGFDTRRAIPHVIVGLVIGGEFAVALEEEAVRVENSGALVAADQLTVLAAAAAFRNVNETMPVGEKREEEKRGGEGLVFHVAGRK